MKSQVEKLSESQVTEILKQSFSKDTSLDSQELWTPERPCHGHCSVASLVAQDYRSGIIRRYLIQPKEFIRLAGSCMHYVNVVDGVVEDYTRRQFPENFPYDALIEGYIGKHSGDIDMRGDVLASDLVRSRYKLLKARFEKQIQLAYQLSNMVNW